MRARVRTFCLKVSMGGWLCSETRMYFTSATATLIYATLTNNMRSTYAASAVFFNHRHVAMKSSMPGMTRRRSATALEASGTFGQTAPYQARAARKPFSGSPMKQLASSPSRAVPPEFALCVRPYPTFGAVGAKVQAWISVGKARRACGTSNPRSRNCGHIHS